MNDAKHDRQSRMYSQSYFPAVSRLYAVKLGRDRVITIDYKDVLKRSGGLPKTEDVPRWYNENLDGRIDHVFHYPCFVELELEVPLDNTTAAGQIILGSASHRSSSVFVARGQIEEQLQKNLGYARVEDVPHSEIEQMMARVAVHELGHALGLVPDGASWVHPSYPGHCGTLRCPMWPFDQLDMQGFHRKEWQDSCHNFLRGTLLDRAFTPQ